jgi:hypothetical protein
MGVTEEAMKFPSLSGSLDFFLGKVSGLMRDAEREDGGNGGYRRKIPSHKKVFAGRDRSRGWHH